MEIKINLASLNDLEGICDVAQDVFPQDFDFENGFDRQQCKYLFSTAINDTNESLFIAKTGEEIVGFAYYINKPPTNGTAILEMIGVKKKLQGQGIGLRLLLDSEHIFVKECENRRIKLATIHLSTGGDNPVGQKLYLKAGYEKIADIPGFVGDGNLELFMLKKISDTKYRTGLWNKAEQC